MVMRTGPDYEALRKDESFDYGASACYLAYLELTGIPIRDVYLNPEAGIDLYRRGRRLAAERFGPEVAQAAPATPHISYGHINALGAELEFPDDGEVNHDTLCDTLEQGVEILKRSVDFNKAGMFPFYVDYHQAMRAAFPDEDVKFTFGAEGPITTAYALRRDGFFYDPYDEPELTKEFLNLVTDSVVAYKKTLLRYQHGRSWENLLPASGLCDDIASMIPPSLWSEFVIPILERYYQGLTNGRRSAHIEDLRPDHLRFLEELGLSSYDPSVSPKVNPKIIRSRTRVPFTWRLCNFHYPSLSEREVKEFVYQSAADGARGVCTIVSDGMTDEDTVRKVLAFVEAGKECAALIGDGAPRSELGSMVSASGKKRFWDHWPE